MRKYLLHCIALLLGILTNYSTFAQNIASGTYTFANSSTPISVTLTSSATINVTGLGGAIAALNTYGVQSGGTVEFDFPDNYTETQASQYSLGSSGSALFSTSYVSVIFKHAGTGTKPLITASTTGVGIADYMIRFVGATNITFDGIDLTENSANTNSTTQMEYGYYLLNSTLGAQNNTIKNCKILLYNYGSSATQQNINTVGIFTSNTSGATTNSGNTFSYDTVSQAYNGIWLDGISTNPDVGDQVDHCVIGSATVGSIGAVGSTTGQDVEGLHLTYQNNFTVYNNIIQNCQFYNLSNSKNCYGVWLNNIGGTNLFYKNQIISIYSQKSGSSGSCLTMGLGMGGGGGPCGWKYHAGL